MLRFASLALLLVFVQGCDEHCLISGAEPTSALQLRDPFSGQCQAYGGGGGYGYDSCDGAYYGDQALEYVPPNPECYGHCSGLDESACKATTDCQAAYVGDNSGFSFYECWQTSGDIIDARECALLGADACDDRDDCIKRHASTGFTIGNEENRAPVPAPPYGPFHSCAPEGSTPPLKGCYGDDECDAGETCNAAEVCLSPPGCESGLECPAVCYGYCVSENTPGHCYGEVTCDELPPDCPIGTLPGIGEGCWTGYCIPTAACEPAPACGELMTEAQCVSREPDCDPIYKGVDCTCTEDVCMCANHEFQRCE